MTTEQSAAPDPVSQGTRGRLRSLDVLRGLTVLGMIIVNAASGLKYGAEANVFPALIHAHWDGLTLADLVFPAFLMMVGVSIPLALGSAKQRDGLDSVQRRRILGRTFRLLLVGFLLTNMAWLASFSTDIRPLGVLQRIGLVYGACALLFFITGPRTRAILAAAILALYWPLALLPSLDGLATDLWARGANFVGSVDRVLLGDAHIYVRGPAGYDPEGLLGTLPAIAHGLIGVAIGDYIARAGRQGITRNLLLAGAAMTAIGLVWSLAFPIVKDIWSSSFVLVTCGLTTIAMALLHAWLDRPEPPTAGRRLMLAIALPFGLNAIAAYVLRSLAWSLLGWDLLLAPFRATREAVGDGWASLIPIMIFALFIWACMAWLSRRNWIIKI